MISVEWNKNNLKSFESKMEEILKKLPETTKLGVEDSLKNTQKKALEYKRGNKDEKLIPVELIDISNNQIVGRVYTDSKLFSYAPYLEYGTGTKLDPTGPGPKPEHTYYYDKSGGAWWLLPVDKISRKLNNKIVYSAKTQTAYYLMFATQPYPFMRPAAFYSRQENIDLISQEIKKILLEVLK